MNIDDLDFRHLRLLEALVRQRGVSATARELDLPQPSVSHGLARLREALKDPLLIRVRGGMEPTPRAIAARGVAERLLLLRQELSGGSEQFSPLHLEREFVIAGSDVGQLIVLHALYEAAHIQAPLASFRALTLSGEDMVSALETGRVDLAFGAYPSLVSGIQAQKLYSEQYFCFAPPNHPFSKSGSMADYLASDHIIVSTKGLAHAHREIERVLINKIPPERVRVVAGSFLVAFAISARSSLLLTAPARQLGSQFEALGLVRSDPPFAIDAFDVRQYWHERNIHDPAHKWLRQVLHRALGS